jgi:hypothetical protein
MALYFAAPREGTPPLMDFLGSLDGKLRRKLLLQFGLLPELIVRGEPHVKHFSVGKYRRLYELRARSEIMVRVIFAVRGDDIILLEPFVKRRSRSTARALDCSVKLLAGINAGDCPVREFGIKEMEGLL